MMELLHRAMAESTWESYQKVWQQFQVFVVSQGLQVTLPLSVHVVALYVTSLWAAGYSHATVATNLSVLAFVHKIRGLVDPTSACLIRKLLLAIKKAKPQGDSRRPITVSVLGKLVQLIGSLDVTQWEKILLHTILVVMYTGGHRVGELVVSGKNDQHTVMYDQLFTVRSGGHLVAFALRLDSYKHDKGEAKWVKYTLKEDANLCPVRLLLQYLHMRGSSPGFLFVRQDGTPVKSAWFAQRLKKLIELAGLDKSKYATHSLRIGATTDLVSSGATSEQIKAFGRWKTGAYGRYVRHNVVVV